MLLLLRNCSREFLKQFARPLYIDKLKKYITIQFLSGSYNLPEEHLLVPMQLRPYLNVV